MREIDPIDRIALMEKLGIGKECTVCEQNSEPYCKWKPDVVDVCEAICTAPTIEPQQRWIPCNERLPEEYGNYLVSFQIDDEPDIGTYNPDTTKWSACDSNGFYWVTSKGLEVIAWMPLPEPYREGAQE